MTDQLEKLLLATHQGELRIGDITIPCAVLEDGQRVLGERNVAISLGSRGSGSYYLKKKGAEKGALLPEYVSPQYLQPFITEGIKTTLLNPILYKSTTGKISNGIKAELLPEICEIWLNADEKGAIPKSKKNTVQIAKLLLRGFAKVGIIGLIDEATGYQDYRSRTALQDILEKFIAKELLPWVKMFPDEYYEHLFRLKNWSYKPLSVKKPSIIGKITNDIIYQRLAPGVLKELQKITPKDDKGRRKHQFHRRLTDDIGHPKLRELLSNVIVLMRASANWSNFQRLIERSLPKYNYTYELPLDEEE